MLILSITFSDVGHIRDRTLKTALQNFHMIFLNTDISAGWVYYHILKAMQYSNTVLETTALVMYDPNTCFFWGPLSLMAL